ncbi:MAG: hypothetical protein Q7U14_13675, partial [Lacisediminimonas sp.]|nr:hypothetical protein [Lacisediminimonas sp.]
MTSMQATCHYRLQRVMQLREMESAACADQLRMLASHLHQIDEQIDGKQQAIRTAQQNVIRAEASSGSIDAGLRMRVAPYIDDALRQQQALLAQRAQTSQALAEARAALLDRRQALRALEIHRQHWSQSLCAMQQSAGQR